MGNLTEEIENFILRQLASEKGVAVLRRNEMATELDCAPSQISYVLSTRFSIQRGFMVESRRGSGGYVRIARIPVKEIIFSNAANSIDKNITLADLDEMLLHFRSHGMISERETILLREAFSLIYLHVHGQERLRAIQRLMLTFQVDSE